MRYASLFRLDLKHPFYKDGQCPDFIVTPTQHTKRLLKNHKCVLQTLPAGLLIRIAVEDDWLAPIIPLAEDALFDFQLRLRNPDFALFTDLSALEGNPAPLYTNVSLSAGDTALALTARTARSTEHFVVAHPAPMDRFVLGGRPLDGMAVSDVDVEGAVTQIEDYDPAGKRITVNTQAAAVGAAFTVDYPVQPRLEAGVFADVALHADASMTPNNDAPTAFTITFQSKEAYWAYYFVTNLEDDQAGFEIRDADAETPISFGESGRTDLTDPPDPDDAVATMLAEEYPEMSRIRFVSDEPLDCRQQPRKKVQLTLEGQTLLGPLPNPSFHNPAILTGTDQTALVQVIKYITHAFSTSNN